MLLFCSGELEPTRCFPEACIRSYEQHNERVQKVIPPERLLVYNWTDGWHSLAHFLDRPIPDEEFPYTDDIGDLFDYVYNLTH